MSSNFWAGPVPPWAYVVGGCLGIGLLLIGMWAGYGRGFKHAEEELRWAREQAKARRIRSAYPEVEMAHEEWAAHEDQALTLANPPRPRPGDPTLGGKLHDIHGGPGEDCWCGYVGHDPLEPSAVISPEELSWTGEIQRMTAAFEEDMARIMGGTGQQLREITR